MSPAFSTPRAVHRALVRSAREVAPAHHQFRLEAPLLAQTAQPGQFVHVLTVPTASDWTFDPLLRRAFSIMSVDMVDKQWIDVLFRVEGRGTRALAQVRVGDEIDLIGPLGQPFDLSPFENTIMDGEKFHVKQSLPSAVVVGGGVGVPPLIYLSQTLNARAVTVHSIVGARSAREIIGRHELTQVCKQVQITTDDGSQGHHGRVTEVLIPMLSAMTTENAIKPIVYACGPLPMLRAVAQVCATAQVRCQVSLEENMPCGIGVCNGCVVRTRQPFADNDKHESSDTDSNGINRTIGNEWSPYRAYRRVCVEGPACWADEIDWEHQG